MADRGTLLFASYTAITCACTTRRPPPPPPREPRKSSRNADAVEFGTGSGAGAPSPACGTLGGTAPMPLPLAIAAAISSCENAASEAGDCCVVPEKCECEDVPHAFCIVCFGCGGVHPALAALAERSAVTTSSRKALGRMPATREVASALTALNCAKLSCRPAVGVPAAAFVAALAAAFEASTRTFRTQAPARPTNRPSRRAASFASLIRPV